MRRILLTVLLLLMQMTYGHAQSFQLDTLQYKGKSDRLINVVIMGDGYTANEQTNFISDAKSLFSYIYTQSPWSNYSNYFNAFAIRVISEQSGTKHPNNVSDCKSASPPVPVSSPNTFFGCSFDSYNIHRLVVPTNISNIVKVLSSQFPNYDQVLVISNSPYYGGSGGTFATSTIQKSSPEILAHEMAHSFASLADEYYAGDQYAAEKPNMTKQTNPTLAKWKNWMGVNEVGIFMHCCGGNSAQWYKPHQGCKMQYLGMAYCSVCQEAIVEKIHALVNPVMSYQPVTLNINSNNQFIDFKLSEIIKPVPNTLNIKWELDGIKIRSRVDSVKIDQNLLSKGIHTLTATVTDTTSLVRTDNHSTKHYSLVSWKINKTATAVHLVSSGNRITYSVFPNPTSDYLNIVVEPEKRAELSIQIISSGGKIIRQISNKTWVDGKYSKTISIADLASGTYILKFNFGSSVHTQLFVKN
jgi:hypothetical protein